MNYTRITAVTASGERIVDIPFARRETAYEAIARSSALTIHTTCNGSTICGLCRVTVEEGAEDLAPKMADEAALLPDDAPDNLRLACRITLPASRRRLVLSTPYWETR